MLRTCSGGAHSRRHAGDGAVGQSAEFGQEREQSGGQDRADARHGAQQIAASAERGIGGDGLADQLVEPNDVALELADPAGLQAAQGGVAQELGLVADLLKGIDQLAPRIDQLGEVVDRPIAVHLAAGRAGDELGDHPRIQAVVLGQHAEGLGELAQLPGIDQAYRQAGLEQGIDRAALVAATGFQADRPRHQRP